MAISIDERKTTDSYCNCCGNNKKEKTVRLWEINFTLGNQSHFVKLCEKHLVELKNNVNITL